MGKFNRKKPGGNENVKKSRKELRKQQRQEKKVRKNDYYTNRSKPGKFVLRPKDDEAVEKQPVKKSPMIKNTNNSKKIKSNVNENLLDELSKSIIKEKKEQQKLQLEMNKQRKELRKKEILQDDKEIKKLEKQLKLNKRKTKTLPASFTADGFDDFLDACDQENMKEFIATEAQLDDVNDNFEEDLALMTGKKIPDKIKAIKQIKNPTESPDDKSYMNLDGSDEENDDDLEDFLKSSDDEEFLNSDQEEPETTDEEESNNYVEEEPGNSGNELGNSDEDIGNSDEEPDNGDEESGTSDGDFGNSDENEVENSNEKAFANDEKLETIDESGNDSEDEENKANLKKKKISADGTWEDIYGRLRDKDGNIITKQESKYVPPAIRAQLEANLSGDKKRTEKLNRLKKQLKGLLNRLAESNMHSISNQIEELYMQNSRNDMNDTLTNLIFESLITKIHTPERLLLEHVLLIVILHANVGTEVGAHFLQTIVKTFNELYQKDVDMDDKSLDNVVNVISQIYNFKVFHSQLLYHILQKLSQKFEEKHVECILNILKSVGFTLRKDDPLALKDLILDLQKRAASASEEIKENPRVKFMLDVLLAIKNNNVNKIPNYDTTYSQHLKKILKSFIRNGNYVTQLNISLDDLLKADEQGKWWVVGSAWTGKTDDDTLTTKQQKGCGFSKKLLKLAKSQRMNTDTRRNIFCIIMSAEDYLDAFEKILHLGLKNQQEREIINVLLHCCLQEKSYNPYYSVLSQKFCDYDRKFQVIIKYALWDKLKALTECSAAQLSNLAKLLTHLFLEKGLAISTLKIVQFSELDKVTLRFMRQILMGVLLTKDVEQCQGVFEKVALSEKLKMFRESLRLFIHHFLLRNIKHDSMDGDQKTLLDERAKMVEKILMANEKKNRF